MIEWREANEEGDRFNQGKECDQPEKHELSPPEKNEDCQTKENSPVEIIEGRLKRLRMKEIDGRKRLMLREEKGWEGGKTKST